MKRILNSKITFMLTSVAGLFLLLSLMSCFGGSTRVPDDHYYRLPEVIGTKLLSPILTSTLSIKKTITYGIYGERTLLYTDKKSDLKLNRYHYHHWGKSPSLLIQDNMLQYLKSVTIAQHVMPYRQGSHSDYILESELISMHRIVSEDNYIAAIVLDIRIYKKSNNLTYFNKRYSSRIRAKSDKLIDTIKAYGESLHNIYDELILDLKENIK